MLGKLKTLGLLALVFSGSVGLVSFVGDDPDKIETLISSMGILAPLLSIALYAVVGPSPVPTDALTLINGAIFGPVTGTVIAFCGNMSAALLEYWIGTGLGSVTDFDERRQRLPLGIGRLPVHSTWFLLGGRMIPGYGGKMVSLLAGAYRVPLGRYVWTTAVPNLIGAAIIALGGFELMQRVL